MPGKAILIVGCTGSGKSTLTKSFVKQAGPNHTLLYDVNDEYTDFKNYKNIISAEEVHFTEFLNMANTVRNGSIFFEEATIFFDTKSSEEEMKEILVKKRHRKIDVFLIFHTFRDVPYYIYNKCTHIILFKTNDDISLIESRFKNPELTKAFSEIKSSKWIDSKKKHDNGDPIFYSPHKILDLYAIPKE